MATVYGVSATDAFVDSPTDKVKSALAGGRVRTITDTYEASAAAAGDIIIMGGTTLPVGAEILASTVLQHDDLGSGVTADLVLVSVADATVTEVVIDLDVATAAATVEFDDIGYIGTFPFEVTAESYLAIRIQDAPATGTIALHAQYSAD